MKKAFKRAASITISTEAKVFYALIFGGGSGIVFGLLALCVWLMFTT